MSNCNRSTAPAGQRSGILVSTPQDSDRVVTADTVACIHCGYNWVWQPGSGKRRGFCMKCNGLVCGRPACVQLGCVHREQLLDNIEAGKPLNHTPISVSVPGGIITG